MECSPILRDNLFAPPDESYPYHELAQDKATEAYDEAKNRLIREMMMNEGWHNPFRIERGGLEAIGGSVPEGVKDDEEGYEIIRKEFERLRVRGRMVLAIGLRNIGRIL